MRTRRRCPARGTGAAGMLTNRRQRSRWVNGRASSRRGYRAELTDARWDRVKDLFASQAGDGQLEKRPRREIVNANALLKRSWCPWQAVY